MDATRGRLVQRREVVGGHRTAPIEQGAVDVERDEADHPMMRFRNASYASGLWAFM